MEPITIGVLLGALVPTIFMRTRASAWMVRQVQAGRMARRTAIWLIALATIAPYAVLYIWIVASSPGYWWLALLLFILSWPVIALPMILLIHQATEPRPESSREPPLSRRTDPPC